MSEGRSSDGFRRHAAAQRRAWLRMGHAERLMWLEDAKRFCRTALAAARSRARDALDEDGVEPEVDSGLDPDEEEE